MCCCVFTHPCSQAAAELDARLNKEARAQAGLVSRTLNTLDQELQSKYEAMFTLQVLVTDDCVQYSTVML